MKRGNFKFTAIGEVLRVHEVENGSLSASFPKDYNGREPLSIHHRKLDTFDTLSKAVFKNTDGSYDVLIIEYSSFDHDYTFKGWERNINSDAVIKIISKYGM